MSNAEIVADFVLQATPETLIETLKLSSKAQGFEFSHADATQLVAQLKLDELRLKLIDHYQLNFSAEELISLVLFHQSGIPQKERRLQPLIAEMYSNCILSQVSQLLVEHLNRLERASNIR